MQIKKKNLIPIIDSRNVINPKKSIFYAIKGPQNDGHNYIEELYSFGVRHFVIDNNTYNYQKFDDATFKLVPSTIKELQLQAKNYRKKFNFPVIGITGSNGKTIVKEWLSQLLSSKYIVAKSPRSFNSQVGVPLSIFEVKKYHNLGVFEAGISKPLEMENLASIIQPSIGILTNIGTAHDEGFINKNQKIEEKTKLFKHCNTIIYRADDNDVNRKLELLKVNKLSWSLNKNIAEVTFSKKENQIIITSKKYNLNAFSIPFEFNDIASLENICHCICCLLLLQYNINEISSLIAKVNPVSMRMEVKKGIKNCLIIDDSYNNDLLGFKTALDIFNQNKQLKRRTVILSDIYQTGINEKELYTQVNSFLEAFKVSKLIGVGEKISQNKEVFTPEKQFYKTTEELLNNSLHFENEIILIKGARTFKFEKISHILTEKQHKAYLDINLTALINNLNFYKSKLLPKTKIMVMVKAFAYGSGSEEIANILQYNRVDYLAVAYADEGVKLRKKGIVIPIMVINPDKSDFFNLVKYKLEPEIYSLKLLHEWINFNSPSKKPVIHIKLDTGMHRLGFDKIEIKETVQLIVKHKLKIASIFSHLATADQNANKKFSQKQITLFKSITTYFEEKTKQKPIKHILNSSGIINHNNAQFDMVRLGIGLYGIDPTLQNKLENVSSFYGQISQIKKVKKGDSIGYGRSIILSEDKKIATINVGYADGISRHFSNGKLTFHLNGKTAKSIGNICMDMFMADITGIECDEGDEVEIFGIHNNINILAKNIGTIPYEILTSISERVKRIYYKE